MPPDSLPPAPPSPSSSSSSSSPALPPNRPLPADPPPPLNVWKSRFDKKTVSRNPAIAVLDIEYNELAQAWKRLQAFLPVECHVVFQEPPRDARGLAAEIRNVQARCMASSLQWPVRRLVRPCDVFLATVDAHALLLALPMSETYLALFYGTLQSIIKASANFPRIMEGLVKLLIEINQSIRLPAGDGPSSFAEDAIPGIAEFYALTFFFLGELMDWYVRKATCRLLQSHCLDVYAEFQTVVCCIKTAARGIGIDRMDLDDDECELKRSIMEQNASHLWEEARLSQVGLQGYDRRCASQNAITCHVIWEIQYDATQRARLKTERELRLLQVEDSTRSHFIPVPDQSKGVACSLTTPVQDLDISRFECGQGPKRKVTRSELQLASRHLEDFFDRDHRIAEAGSDIEVMTDENVATSLQKWVADPRSQVLAIGGSPDTSNPVALVSGCCANLVRRSKVPAVSHFCTLPCRTTEGMSAREQGIISLAYSVIRQLIDQLPPILDCCVSCDLSAERFNLLNGHLTSWKEVLSLIDILLHYAPPLLVLVIDGLDVLQGPSTSAHIQSLIRVFVTHMRHHSVPMPDGSKSRPVLFKALLTVAGRLDALEAALAEDPLPVGEPLQTPPLIADAGAV